MDKESDDGVNTSAVKAAITKEITRLRKLITENRSSSVDEVGNIIETINFKYNELNNVVRASSVTLETEAADKERKWLEEIAWNVEGSVAVAENWLQNMTAKPKAESKADLVDKPYAELGAKPKYAEPNEGQQDTHLALMGQMLLKGQLPPLQVPIFDGRPEHFHEWLMMYENIIESRTSSAKERLMYMRQYLNVEARDIISGVVATEESYHEIKNLLKKRYGHPYVVARAHIDAVLSSPSVKWSDPKDVGRFSRLLLRCKNAMVGKRYMSELNTADNLRRLVSKVPPSIRIRWIRRVHNMHRDDMIESFDDLCKFIEEEAEIAMDPVYNISERKVSSLVVNTVASFSSSSKGSKCLKCDGFHSLTDCKKFSGLSFATL